MFDERESVELMASISRKTGVRNREATQGAASRLDRPNQGPGGWQALQMFYTA
jgi:hypothetical protein